jgi:aryl-alcohol dehydrogenase-like predicted oxidoreductase
VTEYEGWKKKFRPDIPSTARIYDYLLGGKDNYPADRAAAEQIAQVLPNVRTSFQWNRAFLGRAVRYLAADRGIRQFIDIGTGLPTVGNVHEVAQSAAPGAHVVYVDNDPVVLAHGRHLLHGVAGATITEHDLRQPDEILADPELRALIDFEQPVALLLVAILHFIPDDDDPGGIIGKLLEPFPSGSYLVMSHGTADAAPEVNAAAEIYDQGHLVGARPQPGPHSAADRGPGPGGARNRLAPPVAPRSRSRAAAEPRGGVFLRPGRPQAVMPVAARPGPEPSRPRRIGSRWETSARQESMRYRPLGSSGLQVSVVGLGCNNFGRRLDVQGTRAVVDAAIDAGITLFDTADIYGGNGASETFLGEVLGTRRGDIVLATKFGHQKVDMGYGPAAGARGGRAYIKRAVTESLRRLRTDYLDLYQIHTPDPATPIDETIAALDELVSAGTIRYAGHSNFSGWQLADAEHVARELGRSRFISAQNHWSLLERDAEADVVPAARHFGVGVLPYYPVANGLLTGKIRRGQDIPGGTRLADRPGYITDEKLDRVEALISWAGAHGAGLPGRGHRRTGRHRGLRLGDRRRHEPRAGEGERDGRRVGSHRRGARRTGQHCGAPASGRLSG